LIFACNQTYIVGAILNLTSFDASVLIFSADSLQKIKEIRMVRNNMPTTSEFFIDDQGIYY
jgi:hypothetical protein